ncbi:hypothetical protein [cf. Phormidesmis sp. LEGE 11477]|uniref:hypothetical protein n=1 Tax=cf. Phormidesmis sp. LEGE 11477 TaxID=1828680 RepID=UPI0018817A93|nr:hypothetical protein [cf. Phormidesmis sp. LEGE 11477]MBE9064152.1 hypothetical protein [cf. Phormidesmis sp. LEGE 11477]
MKKIVEIVSLNQRYSTETLMRFSLKDEDVLIEIDEEEENQWSRFLIAKSEFYAMLPTLFPEDFVTTD